MGVETLLVGSLLLGAVQFAASAFSADTQADAAAEQAAAELEELERQSEENTRIAQEKKAERVREADMAFATMINSLGTSGGLATANESRLSAGIGANEGFDLASIESNRASREAELQAQGKAARKSARAARTQADFTIIGAGLQFGATAIGAQDRAEQRRRDIQRSKAGVNPGF